MIRARWLAALILASAPLPCQAQFGGMGGMGGGMGGMGGGRAARALPTEEWTVKVEVQNDQSVTGRLKLQAVVVQCDLGLYRIKPEKVKAIEFDPKKEDPLIIAPEGAQRRGTVVTVSGERIAGVISVPHEWEVETDLGQLQPEAQNLKAISFVERVPAGENRPGQADGRPRGPRPRGVPDRPVAADPAGGAR